MAAEETTETVEAPPCAPALVEDCFRVFDKAIKAHQLYLPNNPTHAKASAIEFFFIDSSASLFE